ncbi:outer membrane protein assembly factor BamA [Candidatus Poribacteria bacterium]|nr:outer membrane protein assembly factor BamA [Candidatus Poribacteria bacterium]
MLYFNINLMANLRNAFKLVLIFFLLFFILSTTSINADQINNNTANKEKLISSIEVTGLQNHAKDVVLRTISIARGDYLSRPRIRSDIDKLYKLGFFSEIQAETTDTTEGIILNFIIKENPVLHNIEFIGNEHISNKELKEELDKMPLPEKFQIGMGYREGREKYTIDNIIDVYRTKGYPYVTVAVEKEFDEKLNKIVIRFIIDEGSQKEVSIKKIQFKGNDNFSGFRLRRQMETKAYFPIFEDGYYKENIFKGDLSKLIYFYNERGYANAKILNHTIEFDEKKRMLITIEIYEGPQYKYDSIEIKGNNVITSQELRSVLTIKNGELYNRKEVEKSIFFVTSKYKENGYLGARVDPEEFINEEKKTISYVFNIVENMQMFLNQIKFSGNDVTKDKVIRRELIVYPGDIFNVKKVQRSIERVNNLGFFQGITESDITTEQGNKEDNLNLKLSLKEKPTGQANFGASYSGTDGLVGLFQIAKNNFLGYGQRIDVTWEFGKNLQNYELGFTDPYIFDTKFLFGANIFNTIRSRYGNDVFGEKDTSGNVALVEKTTAFEYRKRGGGIRIGRPLSENLRFSIYYNHEDGEYRIINNYPLPQDVILGETLTRSLTYVMTYDDRDNVFNPTRGTKYVFSWERAGGFLNGDNHYNKVINDYFWYQGTFSKFVFMFHMQMGLIDPYDISNDIPAIEKFSIGGGNTVRGYADRSIADRKKREFYINLEHTYPVEENVNFVMFLDTGNGWDNNYDMKLKDLKSGAGIGFHLETPIGPIRLDYGWGLNLEPDEEKGKFHFNLGWGLF